MKNILITLLWGWILMSSLNAQTILVDTIRIMDGPQMSARIMHSDIHQLKTDPSYKDLIDSFLTNLESIKNEIPDYLNYQMIYIKDINLVVEEITGIAKFKVENGKIAAAYKSNIAVLKSKELKVELFFNDVEELFATKYNIMIEKSLVELSNKNKVLQPWSSALRDNYTYSFGSGILTKGNTQEKQKRSFGLIINPSVGLYKTAPIYEYLLGVGVVSKDKKRVSYAFAKIAYQYDTESAEIKNGSLWGFGYKFSKYVGSHVAFPLNKKEIYQDFDFQLGLTVYPFKGISITTNMNYLKDTGDQFMPSISIGYGF